MDRILQKHVTPLILAALVFGSAALAGDGLVSTMATVPAVESSRGIMIVPLGDQSLQFIAGDEAPAQTFEIIRPRGEPIQIGRLHTSCSCVRLETEKSFYGQGERAIITLRNVRATPPQGMMYTFYVQLTSPSRTTLRYDTFMQSDRFRQNQAEPIAVAPVTNYYRYN